MLQSVIDIIYPPQCPTCDTEVARDGGLCGACWSDTPFIQGLCCESCGLPIEGDEEEAPIHCDDCLVSPRPWRRGRAALVYRDQARRMVLSIKHGDRLDLVRAAGEWMTGAGADLLERETLCIPIPVHWRRLFRRRYNQAALLAIEVARQAGCDVATRALIRPRATLAQKDKSPEARHAELDGALAPHPRHGRVIAGRRVVLIDDVFTSGATLAAGAAACAAAGAERIDVLTLARTARGDYL
ncbi:putative amidophosphoribosyltransferase [Palleronia aestuarii]|uniref:Putative amidophosphoribosyltransferase n=1 Tax=Palleronia aestuarii TaxID=568105 RepID=A0A2W7QB17_9RHOB|nr:double zinc ribbon domain-containing protein [Palleronia aestuarii]PZX18939.1 putative amidophosphoribosyltransferase [Palleronia aestuarii]